MKPETKHKLKAFLWDQFILPWYSLFKFEQIMAIIVSILILNFIFFKSDILFYILAALLIFLSIIDVINYYKSGEFMDHYRKHKYPAYVEYKKAIKEVRAQRKTQEVKDEKEI